MPTTERLIAAGFGGQGILFLGKALAGAGLETGLQVTYLPSYGAEVRGGVCKCHVTFSEAAIASPIVQEADSAIIMNQPSYVAYAPLVREGGLILANISMVRSGVPGTIGINATEEAEEIGDIRVANAVMLGAYTILRPVVARDLLEVAVTRQLAGKPPALLDLNMRAIARGAELAAEVGR